MNEKVKVAIIGPGNIGTDLMIKVMRNSKHLEMGAMVGVDPKSDGLARAERMGVATTAEGIEGLLKLDGFKDIDIVFDATSAGAHKHHNDVLQQHGVQVIDLTPAAMSASTTQSGSGPTSSGPTYIDTCDHGDRVTHLMRAAKREFPWVSRTSPRLSTPARDCGSALGSVTECLIGCAR